MRSDLVLFPARALNDERLTRAHLKVLYHLGRHADFKTGWAWPSLKGLSLETGVSVPTVIKALEMLVEGRYVRKDKSERDDGGHANNRYLVVLDPSDAEAGPSQPKADSASVVDAVGSPSNTAETTPPTQPELSSPPTKGPHGEVVEYPTKGPHGEVVEYPTKGPHGEVVYTNTHITPILTPKGDDPPKNSGGWPARFAELWGRKIGKTTAGEVGAALSELVVVHGEGAVERALLAWADEAPLAEKPQYLTPRGFARQCAAWITRTTPVRVYDERGHPTKEFLLMVGQS